MNTLIATLVSAVGLFCQEAPEPVWAVTEGCENPESTYYDAGSGSLFVSNVAGEATKKDGQGWISKLTIEGKVEALKWVEGLNAPKGMRSAKGTLWVSDIDEVVAIDIATGKVKHAIKIEGAKFLNDVAIGSGGQLVWVSDMMTSRIHLIQEDFDTHKRTVTVYVQGEQLEYPNGLLLQGERLIVASWGKPSEDFTTKIPGRLFEFDTKSGKTTFITAEPAGNLDGLESDGAGGYIVTDWMAGTVLHIREGKVSVLATFAKGTADHAYLPEKKLLILPHMIESRVAAYDLSGLLP